MSSFMKLEEIRSLAEIMKDADLTSLEVSEGSTKVRLEKKPPVTLVPPMMPVNGDMPVSAAKTSGAETPENKSSTEHYKEIKSPMVGVFYAASSPEREPYVKVGSTVKKGDVVCIVEAMKLLNEINADQDGEIAEICAENGQVVEYGQTLFKLH